MKNNKKYKTIENSKTNSQKFIHKPYKKSKIINHNGGSLSGNDYFRLPIGKICYFSKKNIEVDSKTFALLNEKIKMKANKINSKYKKNQSQIFNKKNMDDDENFNFENFSKDFPFFYKLNNNNESNKCANTSAFNNYMNNRLISAEILLNKNRNRSTISNKNKNKKKIMEAPVSPYLQNKFFYKNKTNKNNSSLNLINKKSKNTFPIIKQNCLSKNLNNNAKSSDLSRPISFEPHNKLAFDLKFIHNLRKSNNERGYGKHYGNEKDCPVCQSILMKNNYIMKQMNNYKDLDKYLDNEQIKNNKEQFLQDLKKPYSKLQQEEENIIRQIKYFLNSSKKSNYSNDNNKRSDDYVNLINAYFGK